MSHGGGVGGGRRKGQGGERGEGYSMNHVPTTMSGVFHFV